MDNIGFLIGLAVVIFLVLKYIIRIVPQTKPLSSNVLASTAAR